jgi:hypothetical protein
MTDEGNRAEDPGDADLQHRSLEEVRAELARFLDAGPTSDWRRIELKARTWVRGTTLEWRDLVNTVVRGLLTPEGEPGHRGWHRLETLTACFDRTMKSIIQDYWRREQNPIVPINESAAGLRDTPDPERQTAARSALNAILDALDDDKGTQGIAVAHALGKSPAEIKKEFNLTDTAYESALKRVQRAVHRWKNSGGQP